MLCAVVDWSGGWVTPWGSASQMRTWSEQRIGRPQESTQPERKSTPRYEKESHTFLTEIPFNFLTISQQH